MANAVFDASKMATVMDSDGVQLRRADAGGGMTLLW